MIAFLTKFVEPLASSINIIATVILTFMTLFVVTDVFLRFFFQSPIMGSLEWVKYMLVIVVFWGGAYCQLKKRMVRIDIFVPMLSKSAQAIIDSVTFILSIVVVALITWQTFLQSIATFHTNEIPPGITTLPVWPVIGLAAFGAAILLLILVRDLFQSLVDISKATRWPLLWFSVVIVVATLLIGAAGWLNLLQVNLLPVTAGLIGVLLMLILMLLRMPIAFAMAFIGFIGFWYLRGFDPTLTIFKVVPYGAASTFLFTVLPFFILMGLLCFHAGVSKDLYWTAYRWVGKYPGGLAMATIGGCAGFAAICGDSLATAATMGSISIPEMKKFNYRPSLATGSVAAGGTLGILIPPSIGFIIYGLLTEVSIGKLFMAGIIPGILLASMFMLSIYIRCRIDPTLGARGAPTTWPEKIRSLKHTWSMLLLFIFVLGGIYMGAFTPTEAGALGAFGALVIGLARRKLKLRSFTSAIVETGLNTAMIITILIGVFILGYFISMSQIPMTLSNWIVSLEVSRYVTLALILFIYIILGMLMNIIPMIMITLPIFYPTILGLGFDPIWFGVIMVIMMEMGQITPPVGVNVFVIAGVAKDVPMGTIFKGIWWFVIVELILIVILTAFPQITLWLPNMMK